MHHGGLVAPDFLHNHGRSQLGVHNQADQDETGTCCGSHQPEEELVEDRSPV